MSMYAVRAISLWRPVSVHEPSGEWEESTDYLRGIGQEWTKRESKDSESRCANPEQGREAQREA